MDRISSFGAHNHSLSRLMQTQIRVNDLQTQVATGKRSQDYTGIAKDSGRLINMEVELKTAKSFIDRNGVVGVQLKAMEKSIQAVDKTIRSFITRLSDFQTNDQKDENVVNSIQQEALQAIADIQASLNISVDGQYVFSGGKISTEPVAMATSTLAQFQSTWDGMNLTFPTTRAAHLQSIDLPPAITGGMTFNANGTVTSGTANKFAQIEEGARITISGSASNNKTFTVVDKIDDSNIKLSRLATETTTALAPATLTFKGAAPDGTDLVVTDGSTSFLTFAPGADTITATNAGAFGGLAVGTVFTVAGTGSNDGTYQIAANSGTAITIESVKVTAEALVNATITAESYYQGDSFNQTRRVDVDRVVETGVLATDTAFEKAFRALGQIAQGVYGTAGGLENNLDRVTQAMYLLRDTLSSPTQIDPAPAVAELRGDLNSLESSVAWNQSIIQQTKDKHLNFAAFLEAKAADIENIDITEASTYLLNETNALEASYATMAKVRQLTLLDYLA